MDEYEEAAWAGINDGRRVRGLPELDYTRLGFTQRDVDPLRRGDGTCGLTDDQVEEIDRNARAYGWEIGRGQMLGVQVDTTENNPFMERNWRDAIVSQGSDQAKCDENIPRSGGS